MLTGNTHMGGGCKYAPFCPQSERVLTPLLCTMDTEHHLLARKRKSTYTLGPNGILKQDYAELIHCHTYKRTAAQFD